MEARNNEKMYELSWYINPHLFWLRPSIVPQDVLKMEIQLNHHYRKIAQIQSNRYKPSVGEMVAFYNQVTNKWCRAVVDHHFILADKTNENYIIWLIDSGYPVYATNFFLRPLDQKFCARKLSDSEIIKAGVSGVMPVSEEYDFLNECSYMEKADKWDSFIVHKFKETLEHSDGIKFQVKFCVNCHYFGELLIREKSDEFQNAVDILMETGRACTTSGGQDIYNLLLQLDTINFERFQDNYGHIIRPSIQKCKQHLANERENQFFKIRAKEVDYYKDVEIVECFDDDPLNEIPKNIPAESHWIKKVQNWLDKYFTVPVMINNIHETDEEDDAFEMPMLMCKVKPMEKPQHPATLRKFSSHNISRPSKDIPNETDHKSEIIEYSFKIPETIPEPFVDKETKLLQRLAQRRAATKQCEQEHDTSTVITATESKRTLNILPADYEQIKAQLQRRNKKITQQSEEGSVFTSQTSVKGRKKYERSRENRLFVNKKPQMQRLTNVRKEEVFEEW